MKKSLLAIVSFLFFCQSNAQERAIAPAGNSTLQAYVKTRPQSRITANGRLDTLNLPFVDDFSSTEIYPDSRKWIGQQVYVNNHMAVNHPTKGVATFDGCDSLGRPYDFNGIGSNPSDTLASMAFRLDSRRVSDSVYLSFFYQPEGLGEAPEFGDSLVVHFLNSLGQWIPVWATTGERLTDFKQALICLNNPNYFHRGFRFRIINYSGLSGFLDHWHIDYVRLSANRQYNDSVVYDFAYAKTPESILQTYTQIPYAHFKLNPQQYRKPRHKVQFEVLGYSLQTITTNANYTDQTQSFSFSNETLVANSSDNNREYSSSFAIPPIGGNKFELWATYDLGNNASVIKTNDTITRKYIFENRYAYDDGTSEYGYGLNTNGGRIAYRFISSQPDTLRAIELHFLPIKTDVSNELFTLCVWKSIPEPGTSKGYQLLYQSGFKKVRYNRMPNAPWVYLLDSGIAISDTFYIGWQQNTDKVLAVGLDRNTNANDHMFYYVTGTWQKSGIPGAWAMRPVLGDSSEIMLSADSPEKSNDLAIYPNPVKDVLYVANPTAESFSYRIVSIEGKVLRNGKATSEIQIEDFPTGLYFVHLITKDGKVVVKKILKN